MEGKRTKDSSFPEQRGKEKLTLLYPIKTKKKKEWHE
jgi:hypothetical protein